MTGFQTLWSNHPNIKDDTPILDKKVYRDQCAINLSAALIRSNVPLLGFHGAKSWEKDKPKYAIRAQELADWLCTDFPKLPRKFQKVDPKNFSQKLARNCGVIFFQNYWGPGNQGDHIDLWNGSRLTDWSSWVRIQGHLSIPGVWSDLRKSESIWFWTIS